MQSHRGRSIGGPVVESIVATSVTRIPFLADASDHELYRDHPFVFCYFKRLAMHNYKCTMAFHTKEPFWHMLSNLV